MLGREIVEGKQAIAILERAFDGFVVFHAIGLGEEIKSFIGFAFGLGGASVNLRPDASPLFQRPWQTSA